MATHQQILTKINGITDNGNNTAAEVRSVLTDMLNFSGEGFEFSTPDLVDQFGYYYHFSFKGIKKQCCNLYVLIYLKNTTTTGNQSIMHEISNEDFELLRPFMPFYNFRGSDSDNGILAYAVPGTQGRPLTLGLCLMRYENRNYIYFGVELEPGESISTALAVNFKPFSAPTAATGNTKKDIEAFLKSFRTDFKTDTIK
ncbi:MAG TPA: hypothetical protein VJL37_02470 [Flavobacterium sp.]|nr:hypothetical protein [Flavobacterium sp.]